MIDEELRVQRAVELGLYLTDSRVRMDLASAVAEAATAAMEGDAPDEATLRAYFEQRREMFAARGPLRVRRIWIAIVNGNLGEAYTRARTAVKLLREKQPFEVVKQITGSTETAPVPDRLLAPEELADVLDRAALNVALTLQPGDVSEPIRATTGFHVLQVRERRRREQATFELCRADVEAEYWADRTRQALEANAAELRRSATVQRADPLP
jgi:hypothetical protein